MEKVVSILAQWPKQSAAAKHSPQQDEKIKSNDAARLAFYTSLGRTFWKAEVKTRNDSKIKNRFDSLGRKGAEVAVFSSFFSLLPWFVFICAHLTHHRVHVTGPKCNQTFN